MPRPLPSLIQRRLQRFGCLDLVPLLAPLGRPQGLQLVLDAPVSNTSFMLGGVDRITEGRRASSHASRTDSAPGESTFRPAQHQPPCRRHGRSHRACFWIVCACIRSRLTVGVVLRLAQLLSDVRRHGHACSYILYGGSRVDQSRLVDICHTG